MMKDQNLIIHHNGPEGISEILSGQVKARLEAKLEALYLMKYEGFLSISKPGLDEVQIPEYLIIYSEFNENAFHNLTAAWRVWTFMQVRDRHFILSIFYRHMKLLMTTANVNGSTAIFCDVFIRAFAPILSAQLN